MVTGIACQRCEAADRQSILDSWILRIRPGQDFEVLLYYTRLRVPLAKTSPSGEVKLQFMLNLTENIDVRR